MTTWDFRIVPKNLKKLTILTVICKKKKVWALRQGYIIFSISPLLQYRLCGLLLYLRPGLVYFPCSQPPDYDFLLGEISRSRFQNNWIELNWHWRQRQRRSWFADGFLLTFFYHDSLWNRWATNNNYLALQKIDNIGNNGDQ